MDINEKYDEDFEKENIEIIKLLKEVKQEKPSENFDDNLFEKLNEIQPRKKSSFIDYFLKIKNYLQNIRFIEIYAFGTTVILLFMLFHILTIKPTIIETSKVYYDTTKKNINNLEITKPSEGKLQEEKQKEDIIIDKSKISRNIYMMNENENNIDEYFIQPSAKGGKKSIGFDVRIENNTSETIIVLLNDIKACEIPPWSNIELLGLKKSVVLYAYYVYDGTGSADWGPRSFAYSKDKKYIWKLNK